MYKDWSLDLILQEVNKIAYAEKDSRQTGFVTWGCKQDLYQILWYIESKLEKCSKYGNDEIDYVKKHEQQKLIRTLST